MRPKRKTEQKVDPKKVGFTPLHQLEEYRRTFIPSKRRKGINPIVSRPQRCGASMGNSRKG